MSKELFSVYHCKSCNKIEVSQYISPEQMEELGFTEEELKEDVKKVWPTEEQINRIFADIPGDAG